jgi:predicted transcriptional regulator
MEEKGMSALSKRTRLTVDLPTELKQRLRMVAARRDISVRQYVLETLEEQLDRDWVELAQQESLLALTAQADPVLAELWDNEKDASYDRL